MTPSSRAKFNQLDIGAKIRVIVMLVSGIGMLLATLAFITLFVHEHRQSLIERFTVLGDSLATNSTAALVFDDQGTASKLLQVLQVDPQVVGGALHRPDGSILAGYAIQDYQLEYAYPWNQQLRDSRQTQYHFHGTHLDIASPVLLDGNLIGSLRLHISLTHWYSRLLAMSGLAVLVFLLLSLIAYRASNRLQQRISAPIAELAKGMRLVSEQQAFDLRVEKTSEDEIGQLIDGFNHMLAQIHDRDRTLDDYRSELESKVRQRTAQLEAARDAAEAGSRAKSEFLATMSHEIRTPMNGVLGMTELLLNSKLEPRQQHLANTAYRSAETLLGIIDNILDFSKIEAGKLQLNEENFELRRLLDDCLEMFADQVRNRGLELVPDLPPNLPPMVHGDATRLRQILVNLLGNAVKFTQQGEIRLAVEALDRAGPQQWLRFAVSDTGPGIAGERQQRIFDAFTQADGSTTRRHGGTGLGLAICRQLVELMGGQIHLDSTPGHGSRFYFELPLQPAAAAAQPAVAFDKLRDVRVMIVDDNHSSREILHNQITAWGMRNDSLSSGSEALQRLRQAAADGDPYRIALIERHLPGMDGAALSRAIDADPLLPPLHLIMLSANGADADSAATCCAGAVCHLNKPVRQDRLLQCLRDALGRVPYSLPGQALPTSQRLAARILLAEDNLINQEVALSMLEGMGCQVEVAENGVQALEAIGRTDFDLLLMDCHMPELDGFAASRRIREQEQAGTRARLPIIALTADVQKGVKENCLSAGMDDYLSKPFTHEQLFAALKRWLPLNTGAQSPQPALIQQVLDPAPLEQLADIGQRRGTDTLGKVIRLYLEDAPDLMARIERGMADKDLEQVQQAAHSLKSSSANVGASALARSCARMETAARERDSAPIPQLLRDAQRNLPLVVNALQQRLQQHTGASQAASGQTAAKGPRVLLVDDDRAFRLTTGEVLRAEGFQVEEAESGLAALERAARRTPDLVLLDAMMEGLDGFETCRRLRQHPRLANVPVLMATGLNDIASVNHAFEAGATSFTSKPVNYPVLVQELRFMLRAHATEIRLRDSEDRLKTAQRLARIGYWRWNTDSDALEISDQLGQILGLEPAKLPASMQDFLALVHEQDCSRVREALNTAAAATDNVSCDFRVSLHDDSELFVRLEVEAHQDASASGTLLGTLQDISRQHAAEEQIRKMAYFDLLTGLASRSYFMQHLEGAVKIARRRREQFGLLFIDLDGFKDVNDSLGHDAGDHLLSVIARRLKSVLRDADFVARLGGDEFCVLVDDINDDEAAAKIASTCLQAIGAPLELGSRTLRPRASIGIALFPENADNSQALLKAADSAMYAAKQAGKHHYKFYDPHLSAIAEQRLALEQELHQAVEQNQFVLLYQPQVSIRNGHMLAVEALVRWQHPQQGLLRPEKFVPVLERMGMVHILGDLVLHQACSQLTRWDALGLGELGMSVNISPLHLMDNALVESVERELQASGLAGERLQLEVTENAVRSGKRVPEILQQLKSLGVRIAIDNFGSGCSSLGSLKQLPADCLKVDRAFVRDMLHHPEESVLVGTVVGLAYALGYQVVAEGVETLEQVRSLAGFGCDLAQGNFFSEPVDAQAIAQLIGSDFRKTGDGQAWQSNGSS